MFTNWKRNADKETRLNPLSIDDIDALTIATLRGMGTTPEKFRENVRQDMPEDAMEQGDAIVRRNPKVQMPDSHFKLQGAQEQQMMDDIELEIPEFYFDEGTEEARLGVKQMARDEGTRRALNAYKNTYKDHVMQAFDKHKAFMQSLGNQPMTAQEFMQHPKVPSFTEYYNQAQEGTIPGGDYAEGHPFAITHPKEYIDHRDSLNLYDGLVQNTDPFIPVITGEPMDLAMDTLLKFQSAAQRRIYSEIPTLQEFGLQAKDVPVIRNIPVHRLESAGMAAYNIPVPLRGDRPGDPLEFERQIAREGGATIPGFTLDYQIPDDPRKEIQGHFVYPNDLQSLSPELRMGYPDFNWGVGNTVTLGILDKPEWRAGQAHGRTQPEGYQPFGFDKDAFVRLDGGLGAAAIAPRREIVAVARRLLAGEPLTGDAYKYYDYKPVYDMLSQLPATTLGSQRDRVTGYPPKTSDFLLDRMGGARIVASEPMDLAMDALLKREIHPGYPEDMSIEDMINAGHDWPFNKDKYPDEYLANYPEEHIKQYGERPFNPSEPFILEESDQPLHVGLSQRDIDAYREQVYRETLERMSAIDNDRDNESWAKWVASEAMPPAPQNSPLRMRRQVMVPVKNADENDVDALLDMPDETGATVVQSFAGIPMNEETGFTRSEPMDLAIDALLKNEPEDYSDTFHRVRNNIGVDGGYMTDEELNAIDRRYSELHDDEDHLEEYFNLLEMIELEQMRRRNQSFEGMGYNEETGFTRSEPMALAIDTLLKNLSPEAKRHKLEYDKKYESSPERVKYREELNRERRRRGIYGSGDHMDVSHTEGGKLTLESEHDNRARHFKYKGTLRPSE